jgi:hypothetical protein
VNAAVVFVEWQDLFHQTSEVAGGSHAVAVSNPDAVAETILDAVDAVMLKAPGTS